MIWWIFSLTKARDAICCCPAEMRTPGFPECSSLRAHGRAGFISQLIGSDFVLYSTRKGVDL